MGANRNPTRRRRAGFENVYGLGDRTSAEQQAAAVRAQTPVLVVNLFDANPSGFETVLMEPGVAGE